MSGGIYDHVAAVVLFGVIFGAAVVALPNVGYVSLLSVDQQQLRNVALSALDTLLLDAGYPTNWGSSGISFNPASVVRFGLASSNDSRLYILDQDKVLHLVDKDEWGRPNPMGYLPADTMRQLLGLQGYGFNLKILAPFKVTMRDLAPPADPSNPTDQELKTINYEVKVKFNNEKPIPNAIVNALIFYSAKVGGSGQNEQYSVGTTKVTQTTNELGKCFTVTSLNVNQISDVLIVLQVTVGDINTVTSCYRRGTPPNDIAEISIVGDNIEVTPPDVTPKDAREILSISMYSEDGIVPLYNGTGPPDDVINWGSKDSWIKNFPGLNYMSPVISIFNFRAVDKGSGRKGMLVMGPFPGYLGSRVLSYGSSEGQPRGAAGAKLQRVVNIAGMTYVVEFALWKLV